MPDKIVFPALFKRDDKYVYEEYEAHHGISGDTDSCYMKLPFFGKDADHDEVCEVADTIGQHVNSLFPEFIMDAFNVPESRKDIMQTDREIVSDKSFFVTKKRYAAHVINKEGKPTDETKIMGLEVRKSNTPAIDKKYLRRVIDEVLDGTDADGLQRLVKEFKKEYRYATMEEVAKPSGCKTLKQCIDIYAQTGSMDGFHYAARAALYYNSLCSSTDKKIVPGDKLGIVYIRNAKSKYIAYPLDATTLPKFMDEIIIDYQTMWGKTHKTINNYLKAMEFDLVSRKKQLKADLFGFKK